MEKSSDKEVFNCVMTNSTVMQGQKGFTRTGWGEQAKNPQTSGEWSKERKNYQLTVLQRRAWCFY